MEASIQLDLYKNLREERTAIGQGLPFEPASAEQIQVIADQICALSHNYSQSRTSILDGLDQILSGPWPRQELKSLLQASSEKPLQFSLKDFPALLEKTYRKTRGAVMTPTLAAELLVQFAGEQELWSKGRVYDPACGHGELLLAAMGQWPEANLVGTELNQALALVASLRLLEKSFRLEIEPKVSIQIGDGLSTPMEPVGLILGNPPYVGEKGNQALFQQLRQLYPDLADVFAPRMDLLYLFLAKAAGTLLPRGVAIWLTPPHWLMADGARPMREKLLEGFDPLGFALLEERSLFDALPGNEHLITLLERRETPGDESSREGRAFRTARGKARDLAEKKLQRGETGPMELLTTEGWYPFADPEMGKLKKVLQENGTRLGELLRDYQGFVSGADRVTARHLREGWIGKDHKVGDSIFISEHSKPESWNHLPDDLLRPLLRARHCEKNRVVLKNPGDAWALYVDDIRAVQYKVELEVLLAPFRGVLERRREVRKGIMDWTRLHWPREEVAMAEPKIVVPRRASALLFTLDLSGSVVSSDCTYLLAPEEVEDKVTYLATLMVLLNHDTTERYLRNFGKRKGRLFEFYARPLQELPLPVKRNEKEPPVLIRSLAGEEAPELEEEVFRLVEKVRQDRHYLDRSLPQSQRLSKRLRE